MPTVSSHRRRGKRKFTNPNVVLPAPHPGQITVREQAKRFNFLVCGRRWRKTTLCMTIAVESALQGQHIIWGAPTFAQAFIGWEESKKGAENVASFTQSRMVADFISGGRISYKSLDDPETSRGLTADGIVIDEVADIKEEAYFDVLLPMLMDTGGWMWGIGSPKGLNFLYHEFQKAKTQDDAMAWQIPTVGAYIDQGQLFRKPHPLENPHIKWKEILRLFTKMTEQSFRQEILAEFVENAGQVFRNLRNVLIFQPDKPENHQGHLVVQGVDWGRINDFTVLSTYCVDCNREVDLERFNQISYPFQAQRLLSKYELWKPVEILAEENSIGRVILDNLEQFDLPLTPFTMTNSSKEDIVQGLAVDCEKAEAFWLDHDQANLEMRAFEIKLSPTGKALYGAPKRGHDDVVIARCLVNKLRQEYSGDMVVAGGSSVHEVNLFAEMGARTDDVLGPINSGLEIIGDELVGGTTLEQEFLTLMARAELASDEAKPYLQMQIDALVRKMEAEDLRV